MLYLYANFPTICHLLFLLSVANSLFKFLLLLNGYLLQSEDVCWNRLVHTKRRVKVSCLSRNAFIFPYVYHRSLFFVYSHTSSWLRNFG